MGRIVWSGRRKRVNRRRFIAGVGIVASGLALGACSGSKGTSSSQTSTSAAATAKAAQPGGTLRVALPNEPEYQSLDLNKTVGTWTHLIGLTIFDTLLIKDRETQTKLFPNLAMSFEANPDLTEFTFKLRRGVKFHDGTDLTAEAVQYMMTRVTDPKNSAALAYSYTGPSYKTTEVIDPYTVKLVFTQPNPVILSRLTRAYFGIPSPTAVEKMGDDKFSRNPVGSGPFFFKEWVAKDHVTVTKHAAYSWGADIFAHHDAPYLDAIIFRAIPEPSTRAAALDSGDVNVMEETPPQDVARFLADNRFRGIQSYPQGTAYMIDLNTRKPPTDDIVVRKALNHAINKEAVIKTVFFGLHKPAYSPITHTTFGYDDSLSSMYPYDLGKANQMLEGAGWTMGPSGVRQKDGRELVLSYISVFKDLGEYLQSQLKQIGAKLEITIVPPGTQRTDRMIKAIDNMVDTGTQQAGFLNEDPDIMRVILSPDYIGKQADPSFIGFQNDRLTAILNQQQQHLNNDTRAGLLKQAQRIIMENALIVPIFDGRKTIVAEKSVEGLFIGPVFFYPFFYDVYFAK
jgi:peptide/nickel transport system substrate-binding protein